MQALPSRFEAAQVVYGPKIRTFARSKLRVLPSTDAVDIENELLEVLWLACNTYDPDRGAKFGTHFWNMAQRRFLDLHKAASRKKRVGDYERVWLEDESVKIAVDQMAQEGSAEEEVMARITVVERYRERA